MASMEAEHTEHTIINVEMVETENIRIQKEESEEENAQEAEVSAEREEKQRRRFVRLDSLEQEARKVSGIAKSTTAVSMAVVLRLAFQSIGVVYGDIGTSPLYVFASIFSDRIPTHIDMIGALSLIIYTLTLFPLIKYVFIVLLANDNGDGGTFAMYSLICRYLNVSAIPHQEADRMELSAYKLQIPSKNLKRAERIKEALERSTFAKTCLLSLSLLGTCMVIGDGVLTPCISVLSAVNGVKKIDAGLSKDVIVMISVAILVVLFSIQRFGTDKVGYTFAPVILIWYLFVGIIGIFNLIHHDSSVIKAFNPFYVVRYFKHNPKEAWISLGGVVLCMTGTEAMFADLGHFSVKAIQISFTGLVYPCLLCAYIGQAAYLSNFPSDVGDAFYKSTPGKIPEDISFPPVCIFMYKQIAYIQFSGEGK